MITGSDVLIGQVIPTVIIQVNHIRSDIVFPRFVAREHDN